MARKPKLEIRLQLEIAARLQLLRDFKYDTATDLARSMQLTPQRWYNYETGRRSLDAYIAVLFVEETGVDFNWVFSGRLDTLKPSARRMVEAAMEAAQTAPKLTQRKARRAKLLSER